jgi:hypothetical protein
MGPLFGGSAVHAISVKMAQSEFVLGSYLPFTGEFSSPENWANPTYDHALPFVCNSRLRLLLWLVLASINPTGRSALAMSFVGWVVLGLAAGFIGSQLADRSGKSILPDISLGVVGAVTGG